MWGWLGQNWSTLIETTGIIAGLLFTAFTIRADTESRRATNLIEITKGHRDIWRLFLDNPDLARVFDPKADLVESPVSREEEIFANLVLLHLSTVFHALRAELVPSLDGLRQDVKGFFLLPIPFAVWTKTKLLQNESFIAFVEDCLK